MTVQAATVRITHLRCPPFSLVRGPTDAYVSDLSLVIHSRIYGGQFLSSVPLASLRARSFTASLSTRRTFLRSMAKLPDSCSSTPQSMSTCSPVIRPLMNNTTRFSAVTTRSILQLICALSVQSFYSSSVWIGGCDALDLSNTSAE